MAPTGTETLNRTLSGAEPIKISRTYQSMSSGTDLGSVSTVLTPVDVSRRSLGALWQVGRTRYVVAKKADRAGPAIGVGIHAAPEQYPDKCVACLAPATRGLVFETYGDLLPGGSGRSEIRVGMLTAIASRLNRAYGRELARPVNAGNWQRIWHPVPFCDAHDDTTHAVGLGGSVLDRPWVAFRNEQYGAEFGALNDIRGRSFVRRRWPILLLVAALSLVLGLAGVLAFLGVGSTSSSATDLLIGVPFLAIGGFIVVLIIRGLRRPGATGTKRDNPA